jgi:hypothetical protein
MNKQELFEFVIDKLIEQGVQSVDEYGDCMYRGVDGAKCAVGHLIKDEFYNEEYENNSCCHEQVEDALMLSGVDREYNNFLTKLQDFHDAHGSWSKEGLRITRIIEFAKNYNLDYSKYGG